MPRPARKTNKFAPPSKKCGGSGEGPLAEKNGRKCLELQYQTIPQDLSKKSVRVAHVAPKSPVTHQQLKASLPDFVPLSVEEKRRYQASYNMAMYGKREKPAEVEEFTRVMRKLDTATTMLRTRR
ncbi:MAG: hypothetical protein MMC33_007061 [Icmadophila ericetorum]|nr:hypothetical protein [Icmadophila ericetorum]